MENDLSLMIDEIYEFFSIQNIEINISEGDSDIQIDIDPPSEVRYLYYNEVLKDFFVEYGYDIEEFDIDGDNENNLSIMVI